MRQYLLVLPGLLLQAATAFSMGLTGANVFFEERPSLVAVDRSIMGLKSDFGRSNNWINGGGDRRKLGSDFSEKVMTIDGAVERHYEIEAEYVQFTPYWGYGLTSKWSIFAAVPITHVSSRATATYSNSTMSLSQKKGLQAFSDRDRGSVRAPYDDQEDTIVGQFYIVSQLDLLRRPEGQVVFMQKLRVPTGEHDSLAYYTRGSPEASGYGLELGLISDIDGPALTQWLVHVKGAFNLPDTIYGRTGSAEDGDDFKKIRRDPGETVETGLGVEREVFSDISVAAGYSYVKNFGDKVANDAIAFTDASEAQIVRASLAYRPAEFLQRQAFQGQTYSGRLVYSQTLNGRNITEYDAVGFEFSVAY